MKQAYQVCQVLGWVSLFAVLLLGEKTFSALALLPAMLFFVAATILNRLLPKEDRARVELSARCIIHPYLDLVVVLVLMGLDVFSTAAPWVGFTLIGVFAAAHLVALGAYLWQCKQDKKATRQYHHRTGRRKGR